MLIKKTIGILILVLNTAGVGFLLFILGMTLKDKFFPKKQIIAVQKPSFKRKKPKIINDDIILDEDDLLKDMDLSDLDKLNLDDFE